MKEDILCPAWVMQEIEYLIHNKGYLMSGVEKVQQQSINKPYLNAKNTGYAALGCIGLTTVSAIIKPVKKCHLPMGIITLGVSLLHLKTILNYKKNYREQKEFVA